MRMARSVVKSTEALTKLFHEVAPRFVGRPGGFTRILKTRTRVGDAAPMAFIELVGSQTRAPAGQKDAAKAEGRKPEKASGKTEGQKAAAAGEKKSRALAKAGDKRPAKRVKTTAPSNKPVLKKSPKK